MSSSDDTAPIRSPEHPTSRWPSAFLPSWRLYRSATLLSAVCRAPVRYTSRLSTASTQGIPPLGPLSMPDSYPTRSRQPDLPSREPRTTPLSPASPQTGMGTSVRRLDVELCVVPRSPEIDNEERALSTALVAVVGGTRPVVTAGDVHYWISVFLGCATPEVTVARYSPEDFLIRFKFTDDMLRVLHDSPPTIMPFVLRFKVWRRESMATPVPLLYRVLLQLSGIPAHAWHVTTAQSVLSPVCTNLKATPDTLAKLDLRKFTLVAWCIHPDMIPREKMVYIPEPEEVHVRGPPLYLSPEEMIHSGCPTLRYDIKVEIIDVVDWTLRSDSSTNEEVYTDSESD